MATITHDMETDPITAALPPNSDYMTYLTILEYQLTPERLPILTRHLAEDDGTLAKEVGWDLVKLILPLIKAAPKEAAKCLEVVARRGNPREVVVRVAEALEILGADDDAAESGLDEEPITDELPTFEGEAQRIHLGEMDLHGMPPPSSTKEHPSNDMSASEHPQETMAAPDSPALQLSTLLSMLGILHPRIKTQYPSRFLATSLPAALGAYRKVPITSETASAFLGLLGKLSGKQRPVLPPRSSTANITNINPAMTFGTEVYAPLPDPEGQSRDNAKAPSDLEMSIVLRLLQAVTLEVLEEYLLADAETMEWSTRLLEKHSPQRAIPDRKSRSRIWQDDENLQSKDSMMDKFCRLANDLRLNPEDVFSHTNLPLVRNQKPEEVIMEMGTEKDEDEEPSEFPTSPSQIPYPHLGALFLYLASRVSAVIYSDQIVSPVEMSMTDLHHFVNQFVVPTPTVLNDHFFPSVSHNPPSAIDAMLALLLLVVLPPNRTTSKSVPRADDDYKALISILSYLCAEHPNPSFRTSAHYLATTLLHNHPSSNFRLSIIESTITDCGTFDNLKEVAINWLKEEILFTISVPASTSSLGGSETTRQNPSSDTNNDNENNIFASPTFFSDHETLSSLIFPAQPPSSPSDENDNDQPQPSSPNPASETPTTAAIASLNLLFLLLTNPTLKARYHLAAKLTSHQQEPSSLAVPTLTEDAPPSTSDATPTPPKTATTTSNSSSSSSIESKTLTFLTTLQTHLAERAGKGTREEEGKLGLLALALGRVVGALEAWKKEHERECADDGEGQVGRE
ncbi:hypothetical protein EPUS_00491 [Endocarpon pusillum Z07020]|uniref:DUF1760-domain-containing protein n=1 Tax=Endocarpon pusillum (strain Z07020 / HMAS-L-300199) TaxID=1263415 RepID=U1G2J1_ENDPU|nr:uncharacterized protein EPUS_00491 [Endocarpon pusillum Z07020]ERF71502.1 hypothetical protein EPUS_00491 [Endocarpon pusillum Z07020]